jgi:hypothetical protein
VFSVWEARGDMVQWQDRSGRKRPQGHAMAQAVSSRPLAAEALVLASLCWMYGGQSETSTGSSPSSSVFPYQYHSTVALHSHISSGGWTIDPLAAAVESHGLTPSTSTLRTKSGHSLYYGTITDTAWGTEENPKKHQLMYLITRASPSLQAVYYSHHVVMGTEHITMHTATRILLLRHAGIVCVLSWYTILLL